MRQAPREHTVCSRGTLSLVTLEMVLISVYGFLTRISRGQSPGGQHEASGGTRTWDCALLTEASRSRTLRRQNHHRFSGMLGGGFEVSGHQVISAGASALTVFQVGVG